MENQTKNYFNQMDEGSKRVIIAGKIILMLVLAYGIISYVNSYSRSVQPSSFRSFSVSGEGKVIAVPDIAQFTFSVIIQGGKDIAVLQKENTEKVNKAIEFIKNNGVDAKDIKTQSYNLEPRYQYFDCSPIIKGEVEPCPPPEIAGYTITQVVSVKIRDFSKIGQLLAGTIEKGANSVSQLSFTIDDLTALENQARAEAISKAKSKAEAIAKAGKFSLGKLISIEESGFTPPPIYRFSTAESVKDGTQFLAPNIEPGSQEVSVSMVLKYEIE